MSGTTKKRRKRRTPAQMAAARALDAIDATTDSATPTPKRPPKRIPIGGRREKLHVANKDPNYYYYWAKEEGDWIHDLKNAGYEDVSARQAGRREYTDMTNESARDSLDSTLRLHGGYGEHGAYKLRLMRQPLEFHREDQALEAKRIDETDMAIRRQEFDGQQIANKYGDVSITVKDTE